MIIDLKHFIEQGTVHWRELETILDGLRNHPAKRMHMQELRRFHYLYERVSSDLAKLSELSGEQQTRRYLESLVARAYGEIHESRRKPARAHPLRWFFVTFPRTFRRHKRCFAVSVLVMLLGCVVGGLLVGLDMSAREVLMPFPQLLQDPSDRVAREESVLRDRLSGQKAQGAAFYMTHNTQVSLLVMALGATWGIGTALLLFSNGVMLGAVALDYVQAGESQFLLGWLLPHGVTEITAILLAGQAGFVLAAVLIGWGDRRRLRERLRRVSGDLVTLITGVAVLLVWSGVVEAFLSQYHEPALPYALKIGLGAIEMALLALWLMASGKHGVAKDDDKTAEATPRVAAT